MPTAKKALFWNYHIVWIERDLFGKPFETAEQDNYLLHVYAEFTMEIRLVISLYDWLALGALANCICAYKWFLEK